jgi:hypothetical protein
MTLVNFQSESAAIYAMNSLDADSKQRFVELARNHIHASAGQANLVFQTDRNGAKTYVAIACVDPIFDGHNQFAKRQLPPQFLTDWTKCDAHMIAPNVRLYLWASAFGRVCWGQSTTIDVSINYLLSQMKGK